MRKLTDLHLKTFVAILVMIVLGPLGNVLLGKGMKPIGAIVMRTPREVFHVFLEVFGSTSIWLGIASLLAFFVAYMLVLSWADYSFVQPASSVSYGISAVLAHFMLKEAISPMRWIGVVVICLGVFMVSGTPPRTTDPA
jgi:drug/metabolite transporter (DMT)-like permease